MSKFFFLLIGKNSSLAIAELLSLLEMTSLTYTYNLTPDSRILEVDINTELPTSQIKKQLENIIPRSTMCHFGCTSLYTKNFTETNKISAEKEIITLLDEFPSPKIKEGLSFSVECHKLGNLDYEINLSKLQGDLGFILSKSNPQSKVNIKFPDQKYVVIISNFGIWFGSLLHKSQRKEVIKRSPHDRTFFHPSSMNSELIRTMINLGKIKKDHLLLDPFCGAGGNLLEAYELGIFSVGIEIDRKIIWGAKKNKESNPEFNKYISLIFGDARFLPFKENTFNGIVTDPPYGSASSTKGMDLIYLLTSFLHQAKQVLKNKAILVMCVPSEVSIEAIGNKILNTDCDIYYQRVHRSLTRKIIRFENNKGKV